MRVTTVLLLAVLFAVAFGSAFSKITFKKPTTRAPTSAPTPTCKNWTMGPSMCGAYGAGFVGLDKKTECKACTLACQALEIFFDAKGKTTCKYPYFNYGCHKKHLCIDEKAKFKNQFSAAIAFCALYNGCTFNAKYTASKFKSYIKKNINPMEERITAENMAYGNFGYEDFRAVMMQSVPVKYLLRFKLAQDVLDARYMKLNLEQFKNQSQFMKVEVPDFISEKEPGYWKKTVNEIWEIVRYVDYDLLPETLFTKFINNWANESYKSYKRRRYIEKKFVDDVIANKSTKKKGKVWRKMTVAGAKLIKRSTSVYHKRALKFIKSMAKVFSRLYNGFIKMARMIVKYHRLKKSFVQFRTKFSGKLNDAKKFFLKKFSSVKKFGKLFKNAGKKFGGAAKKLFKGIFKKSKRVKTLLKNKCRAVKKRSNKKSKKQKKGKKAGKKSKKNKKAKKSKGKKSGKKSAKKSSKKRAKKN